MRTLKTYITEALSVNEAKNIDYLELSFKMDKFMPEDSELMTEYWEILDNNKMKDKEKFEEIKDFLINYSDEESMMKYMPKGGTLDGFVKYLIENN